MSGPSKVIVLDPDQRAGRQVQLGFEREGVPAHVPTLAAEPAQLADLASEVPGLVLIGGADGQAVELVRRARELVGPDIPIVSTARGAARADLEAAGADEVVSRPSYLRDLVTICRILRDVPAGKRDHLVGSLVETTGVYTLVRALSSLGRSAVLTLIRGLRRGEVRFYRGEVTSAEVGLIHGQAALHQLLLWTDARFDFAHEDIVRRQQIPLSPDELFADAERFLEGVREHAGALSPATVLEQNVQRIQSLGQVVPTEVQGVLRMFDGHRMLADILEDSPYRVFETLRVAQKAVEVGLLKVVDSQRPKATWRAVLAIDEWLVGNDTRQAVVERTADLDSGPVSTSAKRKNKGKGKSRSKRTKPATPPAGVRAEIDWAALVPRVIGGEVGPLSGVVPAQAAAGEVTIATRDRQREKLEALMDTDKRDRIFPKEIGLEPKVVIADDAAPASAPASAPATSAAASWTEAETVSGKKKKKKKKTEKSGPVAKSRPETAAAESRAREAEARAKSEADARAKADADARAKADADARAKADADARAKADADARAKADADRAKLEADASEQRAKQIAEQNAREAEDEAREAQAKAREAEARAREAAAEAERIAREAEAKAREAAEAAEQQTRVAASVERMRLDRIAREEAEQQAREEAARVAAAEEARTYAARVKAAAEARREAAEHAAREEAIAAAERAAQGEPNVDGERAAQRTPDSERDAQDNPNFDDERSTLGKPNFDGERAARDKATVEAERAARQKEVADALTNDPAAAAMIATPTPTPARARDAATAVAAADATASPPREREPGRTDARALVRGLIAEAGPSPASPVVAEPNKAGPSPASPVVAEPNILTTPPADAAKAAATAVAPSEATTASTASVETSNDDAATTAFTRPTLDDSELAPAAIAAEPAAPAVDPIRAHIAQPLNIIEAGHTHVAVADLVTITGTDTTARVTSVPKVLISEDPAVSPVASTAPAMTASSSTSETPSDATPEETDDEPSDGVVRAMIATADTARLAARARAARPPAPEYDGPEVKEATGEIRERTPKNDRPLRRSEPSILVADLVTPQAVAESVAASTASDLAAAHEAIAAVVDRPSVPPPADAATPTREAEVGDVRKDAVAFSEDEKAFFERAESGTQMTPKFESFDDLDEGYQPVGFWDRVFGRTKPKKK